MRAGVIALALIVILVVIRTTENMLVLVPSSRCRWFRVRPWKVIYVYRCGSLVSSPVALAGGGASELVKLPAGCHCANNWNGTPDCVRVDGESYGNHLQRLLFLRQCLAAARRARRLPDRCRAGPEYLRAAWRAKSKTDGEHNVDENQYGQRQ